MLNIYTLEFPPVDLDCPLLELELVLDGLRVTARVLNEQRSSSTRVFLKTKQTSATNQPHDKNIFSQYLSSMMFHFINLQNSRIAFRIATSAYLSSFVVWAVYKWYKQITLETNVKDLTDANQSAKIVIDDSEPEVLDESSEDDLSNEESDDQDIAAIDIEDIRPIADNPNTTNPYVHSTVRPNRRQTKRIKRHDSPVDYSHLKEEQLTDKLRNDLSKQGYRLIESHAAVKICRWTKNSMRGRGGCYKHTFYGIKSYQCMEMTPNLACASKCTFCWRHHKNPVGTEWKWKMDPPETIVEQALASHKDMIKQLRGVPGVVEERFVEAQTVRHCALSLVGEPIFYPRINELLEMLHARRISTFMVTNAQFPDAMRHLVPVTQLYVSIDAPNKETLKKIDRPLYKDFWERYIECLEILNEKKQRTVFRLTLVQKANMEDLDGYTKLIKIGRPDFIEIKGVTYCGTSKANKLTMENVPWHQEVVDFGSQLLTHLADDSYELACEHSHSNCVLIANTKFKINNKWHTWIDYEKYFELIRVQADTKQEFSSLDYAAESPSWAIFGSEEEGFDPDHIRWVRKEHKLKLLKERIAAQQLQSCSSANATHHQEREITQIRIKD